MTQSPSPEANSQSADQEISFHGTQKYIIMLSWAHYTTVT
jgi:hypothetical protein